MKLSDPEQFEMEDGYQKDSLSDGKIRKKEQKDDELNKKIQALKKKNEALIRRYQEIEEDKKNAEKEGMSVTTRKTKLDSLTITKALNGKRVVGESWRDSNDSEEEENDEHGFTLRMVNEMQLAVTMDSKVKGKRATSKRTYQNCLQAAKDVADISVEETDRLFTYGRGRRIQIAITIEKEEEEKQRRAEKRTFETERTPKKEQARKGNEQGTVNSELNLTVTGQEHLEYLHWKKEREQIDLERLARQKNSKGEWRRAWDVEKTDTMFEDEFLYADMIPDGLNGRRGEWGGKTLLKRPFVAQKKGAVKPAVTSNESVPKTILATSSKAQGKDRLTGRAKRWDSMEGSDALYDLEELSTQEGLDCPGNAGCPPADSGTLVYKEEAVNEETPKIHNPPRQKSLSEGFEKAGKASGHHCVDTSDACCELIKCSAILERKKLSHNSEEGIPVGGRSDGPFFERQMVKEIGVNLPKEGTAVESLSRFNRGRERTIFSKVITKPKLLAREETAESRACFTKTKVDCC